MTMKMIAAAALVAAQLAAAAPARAAELLDTAGTAQSRTGAFAGARFRVELGGKSDGKARAGLTVAPLRQSRSSEGETKLRFGEGLEFGTASGERSGVRVAGHRLAPGAGLADADDRRLGVSTIEAAAIVGGVIVAGFLVVALAFRSDNDD
jgi:hypothetical protein